MSRLLIASLTLVCCSVCVYTESQAAQSDAEKTFNSFTPDRRHELATQAYAAGITELRNGRTSAHPVIQWNKRLLQASLDTSAPDSGISYDQRAAEIESLAQVNLENRTGTQRDLAEAKAARLDAILKRLLNPSEQ